jgi:hypothetical protein
MKTKIYDFYCDPSHGWLKVKLSELNKLGIGHKISHCSYTKGEYAYLEEDCDASLFLEEQKKRGVEIKVREHNSNKSSVIRNYQHYIFCMALKNSLEILVRINLYCNGECNCTALTSGENICLGDNFVVNENELVSIEESTRNIEGILQ